MIQRLGNLYEIAIEKIKKRPNVQSIALLTFWMVASRVLGALRILFIGQLETQEADIFNAAFIIPDNIIAIFIVGSITLAVLPHTIELLHSKNEEASSILQAYFTQVTAYLSIFVLTISGFAAWFTPQLLRTLNYEFFSSLNSPELQQEYIFITRLLLASPMLFALKTLLGSFLNAKKSYWIYATDGVITNVGILLGLTILYRYFGITGAVIGVLIGFGVSAIAFAIDAYRLGLRFHWATYPNLTRDLTKTFQLYYPRLLIIPALRVTETVITATAQGADGGITSLRTALDIQGLPLGLITVVSTVFLPDITSLFVKHGFQKQFWDYLTRYTRLTIFLGVLGGIGVSLATPAVFFILQYIGFIRDGSFFSNQENLELIVVCTIICSASLLFQGLVEIYNRLYVAIQNIRFPFISSITGNVSIIIVTIVSLQYVQPAVAVAIAFACSAIIQWIVLRLGITFIQKNFTSSTQE